MKRVLLLIVASALLVALGSAQTPAASGNTEQLNIKGCLGGSDGNYTLAEENTGRVFKLTSSSADLKTHLGHQVRIIGQNATVAVSSGAAENNFAVAELNMISEHCFATAASPAVISRTSSETVIPPSTAPAAEAIAPAAAPVTAPAETVSTPVPAVATVAAPAAAAIPATPATVSTPSEPVIAPAAPAAPTTAPAEPVVSPAAVHPPADAVAPPNKTLSISSDIDRPAPADTQPTRPAARHREVAPAPAAIAASPEVASTPIAADVTPSEPVSAPSEPVSTPDVTTPKPATPAQPARAGSLVILVSFVVLVLVIGALTPLFNRWRKRKLVEKTGAQNLSFTHKSRSQQGESDRPERPKAA